MLFLLILISLVLCVHVNSFNVVSKFAGIKVNGRINSNRINVLDKKETQLASSASITNSDLSRCDKYAISLNKKFKWGIIGKIVRYVNICFVSLLMSFIFRVLNSLKIVRGELLWKYLFKRDRPLLTVSNHMSMLDDPGLMGAILPYWLFRPDQVRWSLCTEDIFFVGGGKMAPMFYGGNVLPLDRSGSLEQPMFKIFQDKVITLS